MKYNHEAKRKEKLSDSIFLVGREAGMHAVFQYTYQCRRHPKKVGDEHVL